MIENAKIVETILGKEDHGIFTCYLILDGENWGSSFGGYMLDTYNGKNRVGTEAGLSAIMKLLETLEIKSWEDLKGNIIRVETVGASGKIAKIGHIIKDKWFSFEEFFEQNKKEIK